MEEKDGKHFFLSGPAGTGKTFVYKTICYRCHLEGWIVLCVASSGIMALLLPGGQTSHMMFKIPVMSLTELSTCSITKESMLANLIQQTHLIIWDEVAMQHRFRPEAVDRTCHDIQNDDRPFDGITVVFGGDFQQTLPVIPKGSRLQIVESCLCRSSLWESVQTLHLYQNMRLERGGDSEEFASWLLGVGHSDGIDVRDGKINIPGHMRCNSLISLIDFVYPGISSQESPLPEYFLDWMILTPQNKEVHEINQFVLDCFQGDERVFLSADSIIDDEGSPSNQLPSEYLCSINSSNLPPSELRLKPGCPVILLQNLAPAQGLCNGTRMTIFRMSDHVLKAQIIGGDHHEEVVFIPRLSLTPSSSEGKLAFTLVSTTTSISNTTCFHNVH